MARAPRKAGVSGNVGWGVREGLWAFAVRCDSDKGVPLRPQST